MWPKGKKQEVTKFGSHSLRGFRVAANGLMVRDKIPPAVVNRVKFGVFQFDPKLSSPWSEHDFQKSPE